MHGSGIPGRGSRAHIEAKLSWSTPTLTDITHDQDEQTAAMMRVPKIGNKRDHDLDWASVSEADQLLATRLLLRLEDPCAEGLKTASAEHNGSVPHAYRRSEQEYIDDIGEASSEVEATSFDAQYLDAGADDYRRRPIRIVENAEPDPQEEPEEQDRRRERKIRDRAIIGLDLFSKIPLIIHNAVRTYNPSKKTTLESWVRIHAYNDAIDYLRKESGIAGTPDRRKRDKTQSLPIDIYERSGVAHWFRAADGAVKACLRKGRANKHRGKIRLNADGENTYLRVLELFWKGQQSHYVLTALGRPHKEKAGGQEGKNGPSEIARKLGIRPNLATQHIAKARREIPSLRIADEIETARVNYSKNLRNKKIATHFSKLIRTYSEGVLPPVVAEAEAEESQREQNARYQRQPSVGTGSQHRQHWEKTVRVLHRNGKKQSLPTCKGGKPRVGRLGITVAQLSKVAPARDLGGHRHHRSARRLGNQKVWSGKFPGYDFLMQGGRMLRAEDIAKHTPKWPRGGQDVPGDRWYASQPGPYTPLCPYTGSAMFCERLIAVEMSKSDVSGDMRSEFIERIVQASRLLAAQLSALRELYADVPIARSENYDDYMGLYLHEIQHRG